MHTQRLSSALTLVLLLCACPKGDPSDSDSGSADTTAGDSSVGASETTDTPTEPADATTAEPTTTDEPATTDADPTDEPATTDADPTESGLDDGCAAYCAKLKECDRPGAEGCSDWCPSVAGGYGFIGDACLALNTASNNCFAGLTCAEIDQPVTPCDDAQDAIISDACVTQRCSDLCDKVSACAGGDPSDGIGCKFECSFSVADGFSDGGEPCTDAIDALHACVLTLTCEQIDNGMGCEAEDDANAFVC